MRRGILPITLGLALGFLAAGGAHAEVPGERNAGLAAVGQPGPLGALLDRFTPQWIEGNAAPAPAPATATANAPAPSNGPRDLDRSLRMCFFVDEDSNEAAVNDKIATMYHAYAGCNVALVPMVFTMKRNYRQVYAGRSEALSDQARRVCNLNSQFGARGAIQIDTIDPNLPKAMCRDPDATGCSTLCEPLSMSMVGPAAGPIVGLHESMHSNCCGRVCVNRGEGVERAGPGIDLAGLGPTATLRHAEEGGRLTNEPITPAACASIRAGAERIPGMRYDPRPRVFYAHARSDSRKIDLVAGRSVFEQRERRNGIELNLTGTLDDDSGPETPFDGAHEIAKAGPKPTLVPAAAAVPPAKPELVGEKVVAALATGKASERVVIDETYAVSREPASATAPTPKGRGAGRARSTKRSGEIVSTRSVGNRSVDPDKYDPELSPYE